MKTMRAERRSWAKELAEGCGIVRKKMKPAYRKA